MHPLIMHVGLEQLVWVVAKISQAVQNMSSQADSTCEWSNEGGCSVGGSPSQCVGTRVLLGRVICAASVRLAADVVRAQCGRFL